MRTMVANSERRRRVSGGSEELGGEKGRAGKGEDTGGQRASKVMRNGR